MHEFLSPMNRAVLHYLANSAVTLVAIGAIARLGDRWLGRIGPAAQHRLWVAAMLSATILPLLPSGMLTGLGTANAGAGIGRATVTHLAIAAAGERWALWPLLGSALVALYLATVLFCVMRLIWRWRQTAAMARRSAVLVLDESSRALVEEVARRLRIGTPEIRCSNDTQGPVVLGARRAMLLTPVSFFAAGNVEDIAAALAHECAHIARRDYTKNLIYEVAAAAIAYHPVCRLLRRRIGETRELVCDELAAAVNGRLEYAASLLRLATALAGPVRPSTSAIGVFDGDILEERIMRLTMDVPKVSKVQRVAMVALTTCALLGGAATAAALSDRVTPLENATSPRAVKEKIYHVGNGVTAPVLSHSVDAEYSKKAKDAKYQGVSVVSLVVDAQGMPQHVHTVRKLGMGLDEKALEAVRQYRFKPSTLDGKPVAVAIMIEVNFHIY